MTADGVLRQDRAHAFALHAAAAALLIAILVASGGWLHTVRDLNRLTAYHPVGAEALRMARSAHVETAPAPNIYAGKWE